MAIFSSHTSMVQRSSGKNAVASSAYNSRTKLELNIVDASTGIVTTFVYDYSEKESDLAYSAIHAPEGITEENAPWVFDRQQLWNRVESAELRVNSQTARKIMFALPKELTVEQNIELVKQFVDEYLVSLGMVVDVNIHADELENPHVHLMLTTRELVQNRYGEYEFSKIKNREWGKVKFVEYHREAAANVINEHLAKHGFNDRVSHLSHKDRGIDLAPGVHEGPARHMRQAELKELNAQIAFDNAARILENPELVLDKLSINKPVFTKEDIAKALEEVLYKGLKLDGLSGKNLEAMNGEISSKFMGLYAKVMSSDQLAVVVEDDLKGRTLYAKTKRIELEKSYIELVQELHSKSDHALHITVADINDFGENGEAESKEKIEERKKLALNEEQTKAVIELMAGEDLVILEGLPGTGKTRMMRQIVRQSQKSGYKVIGVAPSSSAALQLEKDAGIVARNASLWRKNWLKAAGQKFELVMRDDYFLEDKYQAKNSYLTDKHIMIIDEASMCDLTSLHYLLSEANRAGAKVIMVGDTNQLSAVGYAGGLHKAVKECGSVQLVQTQRQSNQLHRDATLLLSQYRIEEALKIYQDTGALVIDESELSSNYRLINDYVDSYLAKTRNREVGKEALVAEKAIAICVYTNEEARYFNTELRQRLLDAGILRGKEYEVRVGSKLLKLVKGEQVIFTRNFNNLGASGIYNGEVGTLLGVSIHDKIGNAILKIAVSKADGAREVIELDTAKCGKGEALNYSYAVTAHKLQGASIDEVFVKYCKNIGYEAFNVMMTRHRNDVKLYAAKETLLNNILQRVDQDSEKARARYDFDLAENIELVALSISSSKKTNSSFAADYVGMGSSVEDKLLKSYLETRKTAMELINEISHWQLAQKRLTGRKPSMTEHKLWRQFSVFKQQRDLVAGVIVKDYAKYEDRVIQMGINYSTLKRHATGERWYKVDEKQTNLHMSENYVDLVKAIEENKPKPAKMAWQKLQQELVETESSFSEIVTKLRELREDQHAVDLDILEERKFRNERLPRYLSQIYAAGEDNVDTVLAKWNELKGRYGVEEAASKVQSKPKLLGALRGVGLGGFVGFNLKRMYAIVHIERIGEQLMAYERSMSIEQELMTKQRDMNFAQEISHLEQEISKLKALLPDKIDEQFLVHVGEVLNVKGKVSRIALEKIDLTILSNSDKFEEIKLDVLQAEGDGLNVPELGKPVSLRNTTAGNNAQVKKQDNHLQTKEQVQSQPRKARIKFEDVNARLSSSDFEKIFYKYASHINPDGRIQKRGQNISCGTLTMNLTNGLWYRFSDNSQKGNIYGFVQQATSLSKAEALEVVAGEIGMVANYEYDYAWQKSREVAAEIVSMHEALKAKVQSSVKSDDWQAYGKVASDAPTFNMKKDLAFLAKNHQLISSHEYRNARDEIIGYTVRVQEKENTDNPATSGKKQVYPVAYCQNLNQEPKQSMWRLKGFTDNGFKPIYGAEKLASTLKPVLIVEGEKTADRAQELLPEYTVISWMGGSQATGKVNWQQLQSREVVIWPDNDAPGMEAARSIQAEIDHANGFRGLASIVDTEKLNLPEKWDLADELPEHMPLAKVKSLVEESRLKQVQQIAQMEPLEQAERVARTERAAEWAEYLSQPGTINAVEYVVRSGYADYEHEYMTLKSGIYRDILAAIAASNGKAITEESIDKTVAELEVGYLSLRDSHDARVRVNAKAQKANDNRDDLKASLVRDIAIWQQMVHGLDDLRNNEIEQSSLTKVEVEHIEKTVSQAVDGMKRFSDHDKEQVANDLHKVITSQNWQNELLGVNQKLVEQTKLKLNTERAIEQQVLDLAADKATKVLDMQTEHNIQNSVKNIEPDGVLGILGTLEKQNKVSENQLSVDEKIQREIAHIRKYNITNTTEINYYLALGKTPEKQHEHLMQACKREYVQTIDIDLERLISEGKVERYKQVFTSKEAYIKYHAEHPEFKFYLDKESIVKTINKLEHSYDNKPLEIIHNNVDHNSTVTNDHLTMSEKIQREIAHIRKHDILTDEQILHKLKSCDNAEQGHDKLMSLCVEHHINNINHDLKHLHEEGYIKHSNKEFDTAHDYLKHQFNHPERAIYLQRTNIQQTMDRAREHCLQMEHRLSL